MLTTNLLLVRYQQSFYFPIFKDYPETTFGGVFETATDYQDPAVKQLIQNQGWMISPPVAFSYQSPNLSLTVQFLQTEFTKLALERMIRGRDVFARILYGLRVSPFGFVSDTFSAVIGVYCRCNSGLLRWLDRFNWATCL